MNIHIENNVCVCENALTFNVDLFKRLHKKYKFSVCIILISTEVYIGNTHDTLSKLLEYCYNKYLKIYYVYSSIDSISTVDRELFSLFENTQIYERLYPFSHLDVIHSELNTELSDWDDDTNEILSENCKLYLNANSRDKHHRYILMDMLTKNNLVNSGLITWNSITSYKNNVDIGGNDSYILKYWYPTLIQHDYFFEYSLTDTRSPEPGQYNTISIQKKCKLDYFLEIVTESELFINRITEKTLKPLLYKKPFLVLTSCGFHKELKNFGFELYDEIFDYSFDELPSHQVGLKAELICQNLIKLKDKSYNELQKIIEPKLVKNKNRLIDIYNNKYFFDKELRLLLKNKTPYFYKKYFLENKIDIYV
jgi:hypothetical protein